MAKKLIGIYFTLFQLILQGKVGQAFELQTKKDAQEASKVGKGSKAKGGKVGKHKKERWRKRGEPQGKPEQAKQRDALPPLPASQVTFPISCTQIAA